MSSECAWTASKTLPWCGVPVAGRSRKTLDDGGVCGFASCVAAAPATSVVMKSRRNMAALYSGSHPGDISSTIISTQIGILGGSYDCCSKLLYRQAWPSEQACCADERSRGHSQDSKVSYSDGPDR